ncbi:hypothetical protein RIF24_01135 [Exiguobacterium acetylicum]|uniref:hypothetical protein n=1 Tax=Exiguobacterium acetylicum TaxID=41170 RepID=UPI002272C654|nr:hypothetical protein [Exiguobacterium sp. SL14]MCY1692574.1 hypothetical protein [Exiguobacterium sp. SL14]
MKHISLFLLIYTAVVALTYIVSRFAPDLLLYMVYIAIASLIVITGYLLKRLVIKR